MIVTITSKGQITIPLSLRRKFHLNAGDKLDFDEDAPVLLARRAIDQKKWDKTISDWKKSSAKNLKHHPWGSQPSASIIGDLRDSPLDSAEDLT